jgi:DNA polymerase-3 subunit delta'
MAEKSEKRIPLGLIELLDKELQAGMLSAALSRKRLGGTLLFSGPDGSGKSSLAFWLAAALNCDRNGGVKGPCGACPACRRVAALSHPDVFWVFPVPGGFYRGEQVDEARLAEVFAARRSAPWLDVQVQEKSEHHLPAVARIRAEAQRSAYEGGLKVFVITHADRLRIEASNAFLKLLEEPRPGVIIILCTNRPASLTPTILSRCQRLQVRRPGRSSCLRLLGERLAVAEAQAAEWLEAADGNLTAALRMMDTESFQIQKLWVEKTFEALLDPGREACFRLLEERKGPLWNRGDFERYLAYLTRCFREVLIARLALEAGPEGPQRRGTAGISPLVERYSARVQDTGRLLDLLGRLVNLRDELNRNVNLRLLGWSILLKMRKAAGDGCRNC